MSKRIIFLSDGTGNSAAQVWRTNVWRVFTALDLTSSDQVAFYDDGVGTSLFKPMAILGGAFGVGLKRNVLNIYKFVSRNYVSSEEYRALDPNFIGPFADDQLFGFGFSRGAYTIRVVTGLIASQGLASSSTASELDQKALAAYRAYRAERFRSKTGVERFFRRIRDLFVGQRHDAQQRPVRNIAFLGLWDSVAAYGLPIDEMTRGVSRYLWPLELPDRELNPKIRKACHALALDDERTTFHPLLWNEENVNSPPAGQRRFTHQERLSQVWFAGVHSNVGGGYPDDSLAHVSLNWMITEACRLGLRFKRAPAADPDALINLAGAQDKDGRLYDSRTGVSGYYRYGPRDVQELGNARFSNDPRDAVHVGTAKIHESALARLRLDAHPYAPTGLPENYEIVRHATPDGSEIIPLPCSSFETPKTAAVRFAIQKTVISSAIWRRRIVYFLTVIATVYLVAYPLRANFPASSELSSPLRPIADLIRLTKLALPGFLGRWVNAYTRDLIWFLTVAVLVSGLLWLGGKLKARIFDLMRSAWNQSLTNGGPTIRLREPHLGGFAGWSFQSFAVGAIVLAFLPWKPESPFLNEVLIRLTHPFVVSIAIAVLITLWLPTKWIASIRNAPWYQQFLSRMRLIILPAFFAIIFAGGSTLLVSHYVFTFLDSFGLIRKPSAKPVALRHECDKNRLSDCGPDKTVSFSFDTSEVCTASGVYLQEGQRYRVALIPTAPWTYAGAPSSAAGKIISDFLSSSSGAASVSGTTLSITLFTRVANTVVDLGRTFLMVILSPALRTLDRPHGRVMLRYGDQGNEENFMDGALGRRGQLGENFTATRNGELFIYLNKPVSPIAPHSAYGFSKGVAKVVVYKLKND
jgi:uncharacterized protein (DUF2235 family)